MFLARLELRAKGPIDVDGRRAEFEQGEESEPFAGDFGVLRISILSPEIYIDVPRRLSAPGAILLLPARFHLLAEVAAAHTCERGSD